MISFGKSKRTANLVIDDYVIRMVENNGKDLTSIKIIKEKPIPLNTIENGKIVDELAFFDFMKEVVQAWGIKKRNVRFYVPHTLVIMREIELPEEVKQDEIKQYITMEIGNTIHFPFENPVFDVYEIPQTEQVDKVTVLAAPEEEIIKYTEIFADVKLTPVAVDVQALGVYRYFLHQQGQLPSDKVYMFVELNLTSINISIFHQHKLEFLRYQPLTISVNDWQSNKKESIEWIFTGDEISLFGEIEDQINEIERLMNFYRFSLHQGEKTVTDIILLGDYPDLQDVQAQLQNRYTIPTTMLHVELEKNRQIDSVFIPALGLSLKGGE